MSVTCAEIRGATRQGVLVWRHGGRCSDSDRRPVGRMAGCVREGFGGVAACRV